MTSTSIAVAAAANTPATTTAARVRNIFGGSIGNLVEWFDWYVFSAFTIYFSGAFFPSSNGTLQLMNTTAIFAAGFFMRPIGSWVLGRYADRHGRKAALTLSVTLMCLGSLMIAVMPTYETIGSAAPMLLLLVRLLQGFSVGGEYGTSATYMSEVAPAQQRGFYSGVLYVTLVMGQLLALGLLLFLQAFVLSDAELSAWGWRIPFFVGACAALVAFYLRRNLDETEAYRHASSETRRDAGQLRQLLRYPREALTVVGLTMGGTLYFYVFTNYMQKFLVNTVGLTKMTATLVAASALFIFMLLQPLMGALSDRVGRRPMLITFGVLALLTTVPLLSALADTRSAWVAFWLITTALVISSLYSSISAIVKAELFPVHIRALGVGLPYSIAVSLFGATADPIALKLKDLGHESWFYWYVTVCVFISLLVYLKMGETKSSSRI